MNCQYLRKQSAALREVNDSRLRIYENLEVSINDIEKSNIRLMNESNNQKKTIKTLVYFYLFNQFQLNNHSIQTFSASILPLKPLKPNARSSTNRSQTSTAKRPLFKGNTTNSVPTGHRPAPARNRTHHQMRYRQAVEPFGSSIISTARTIMKHPPDRRVWHSHFDRRPTVSHRPRCTAMIWWTAALWSDRVWPPTTRSSAVLWRNWMWLGASVRRSNSASTIWRNSWTHWVSKIKFVLVSRLMSIYISPRKPGTGQSHPVGSRFGRNEVNAWWIGCFGWSKVKI